MTEEINAKELINYDKGDKFRGYLIIKESEVSITKNEDYFLSLTVADKSGEINGKIWDVRKNEDETYPVGKVVMVTGTIGEYRDSAQMNYDTVTVIDDSRPEANPQLYIRTAPVGADTMMAVIKEKIDSIIYEDVQEVVRHILNKYSKELFTHAAATKLHHAYSGGLGYHIISMLKLAETVVEYYPNVDHSILYSGVILHDIGKIQELTSVMTGSEYTIKGKLLGHISMIETEIVTTAIKKGINPDSENIVLLRHMMLSHHGKQKWGSAVVPQTREAHALHYIDMLDARMNMTHEALLGVDEGDFSPRVWALEGAAVYNPTEERGIVKKKE